MKELITSEHAPAAIGAYSHGTAYGDLIFTSGQLPVDSAVGKVVEGDYCSESSIFDEPKTRLRSRRWQH